jgi:hypothetical protein
VRPSDGRRRSDRQAEEAPGAEAPDAAAPSGEDRARRFLDLWERNLSYLALNGPVPGDAPER